MVYKHNGIKHKEQPQSKSRQPETPYVKEIVDRIKGECNIETGEDEVGKRVEAIYVSSRLQKETFTKGEKLSVDKIADLAEYILKVETLAGLYEKSSDPSQSTLYYFSLGLGEKERKVIDDNYTTESDAAIDNVGRAMVRLSGLRPLLSNARKTLDIISRKEYGKPLNELTRSEIEGLEGKKAKYSKYFEDLVTETGTEIALSKGVYSGEISLTTNAEESKQEGVEKGYIPLRTKLGRMFKKNKKPKQV